VAGTPGLTTEAIEPLGQLGHQRRVEVRVHGVHQVAQLHRQAAQRVGQLGDRVGLDAAAAELELAVGGDLRGGGSLVGHDLGMAQHTRHGPHLLPHARDEAGGRAVAVDLLLRVGHEAGGEAEVAGGRGGVTGPGEGQADPELGGGHVDGVGPLGHARCRGCRRQEAERGEGPERPREGAPHGLRAVAEPRGGDRAADHERGQRRHPPGAVTGRHEHAHRGAARREPAGEDSPPVDLVGGEGAGHHRAEGEEHGEAAAGAHHRDHGGHEERAALGRRADVREEARGQGGPRGVGKGRPHELRAGELRRDRRDAHRPDLAVLLGDVRQVPREAQLGSGVRSGAASAHVRDEGPVGTRSA
jgi:hypothetical protein